MVDRPARPSAQKVFFDQAIIPMAIDAAATVEAGLERISVATRRSPYASMAVFIGLGWLLAAPPLRQSRQK